jgi:hypothetical protein
MAKEMPFLLNGTHIVKFSVSLVVALLGCAYVSGAHAAHICWIDQISRVDDGVKIEFVPTSAVRILASRRVNAAGQRVRLDGQPLPENSQIGVQRDRTFIIEIGDTVTATQIPEDMCRLTAEVRNGQLGITANSTMRLPDLSSATASEFIVPQ